MKFNSDEINIIIENLKTFFNKNNITFDINYFYNKESNPLIKEIYNELEKTNDEKYFNILLYLDVINTIYATFLIGKCYHEGTYVKLNYSEAVKWYTKAAEQGDTKAQYNLALMYDDGDGVDQDYTQAIYWYTKAAEQGDVEAQNNLGVMYDNGDGVTQDYNKAVYWYTKAAEQGDTKAQYNLGVMYYNGKGVTQDYTQALYWFTKSAKQGYANAQYEIGTIYFHGIGVPQDYSKAIYWFEKSKMPLAYNNLAVMYMQGIEVEIDLSKSIMYYHKMLENKNENICIQLPEYFNGIMTYRNLEDVPYINISTHALAYSNLSSIYVDEESELFDLEKARDYLIKALDEGYIGAKRKLAASYMLNDDNTEDLSKALNLLLEVPVEEDPFSAYLLSVIYWASDEFADYDKAYSFALKAYESGIIISCNFLGDLYYYGDGVSQNYSMAVKYYEEAAEYNLENANLSLGKMYKDGIYFEKSLEKAKKYFESELEINPFNEEALFELGNIYFNGEIVEQNYEIAKEYYEQALEYGKNCEYVIELCNRALNQNADQNFIRKSFECSNNINDFLENIRTHLDYSLFDCQLQIYIHTSLEIYYLIFSRYKNDSIERDYSSITTPLIKAIEYIIKNKIINKYKLYLGANQFFDDPKIKKANIFTLGNLEEFLSIKEVQAIININGQPNIINKVIMKDERLFQYLKNNIFNLDYFDEDVDQNIKSYLWKLNQDVKNINNIRIPSVHDGIVDIETAEVVINYLLFDKKVLINFIKIMI